MSRSGRLNISTSSSRAVPPSCITPSGNRRSSDSAVMDLPQPDSPSSAKVSPAAMRNEISSTMRAPLRRDVINELTDRMSLTASPIQWTHDTLTALVQHMGVNHRDGNSSFTDGGEDTPLFTKAVTMLGFAHCLKLRGMKTMNRIIWQVVPIHMAFLAPALRWRAAARHPIGVLLT